MACVYPKVKKAGVIFLWLAAVTIPIGFALTQMMYTFNAIYVSSPVPRSVDLASYIVLTVWVTKISLMAAGGFAAVGLVLIVFAMWQNSKRPHDLNHREVE